MEFGPKTQKLVEKMGRNLLLFQEVEYFLKGLVSLGSTHSSIKSGVRDGGHSKRSLGLVAATFLERHLSEVPPKTPEVVALEGDVILQTSFCIGASGEDDLAERIRRAITDRNRLAHTMLVDFDLNTGTGMDDACRWLDVSHEEHSRLVETLRSYHREVRESFLLMLAFLRSKEGMAEFFLPDIQLLPIMKRLLDKAASVTDGDGWVPMGEAAKSESKAEVNEALERFGMKSLTELMVASQLFEVRAEETARGGTRMVYRLGVKHDAGGTASDSHRLPLQGKDGR